MTTRIYFSIFLLFIVSVGFTEPELKSGDIIFQTSTSTQSYAIMWASKSVYSHVGIVEVDGKNIFVIEAISKVSRTPLEKWIERGKLGRYSVFRLKDRDAKNGHDVVAHSKTYIGRGYDIFFSSKNDDIYCSELVALAYENSGLKIGKRQKVKELDTDNLVVRELVKKLWRRHPVCKGKSKKFEDCWNLILEDELVTPESIAQDEKLVKVWSNYP